MNILDMRTVLFSYVISNAVCATMMTFLWLYNRRRAAEVGFWLADYLMQFAAVLLIALRGILPDFASIVISNALIIGGTILLFIGLECYADKTSVQTHNYILLALFIFIHTYFTYLQPSLKVRTINFSICLLLVCFQCAWLMLYRVKSEMRLNAKYVGMVFSAYSLFNVARIFVDLAIPHGNDFFKSGLFDTLIILIFQMLFIMLTFALSLMVNRQLFTALEKDIKERKRAEQELRSISRFPDENPNPIFRFDNNGNIIYANSGCQLFLKMWGRKVGQSAPQELKRDIKAAFKSGKSKDIEMECNKRYYSLNIIPVLDEKYVNVYGSDITVRKRAEEITRTREERFHALAQTASDAIININSDGNIVFWNKAAEKIFGYSANEIIGKSLTDIMPERFRKAHAAGVKRVVSTGELRRIGKASEVTGLTNKGLRIPLELSLATWKTHEGIFFTGIARDITERKRMEETLRLDSQMMASITNGILLYKAKDAKIVFANPQFEKLFGYEAGELIGKHVSILNAPTDKSPEKVASEISASMMKNGAWDGEIKNIKKDGTPFWCHASVSTFTHKVYGSVWVAVQQDITARKQAEEELTYLSTHDSLTGLYNRSFFNEEMKRLQRGRQFPISIVMADVNDLKALNDEKGHAAGDKLLQRAAQVLTSVFRTEDIVARIGGDEFAILLPNTDEQTVEKAISRVMLFLDKDNKENEIPLEISMGTSTGDKKCALADVLKAADDRMYLEKKKKTSRAPRY